MVLFVESAYCNIISNRKSSVTIQPVAGFEKTTPSSARDGWIKKNNMQRQGIQRRKISLRSTTYIRLRTASLPGIIYHNESSEIPHGQLHYIHSPPEISTITGEELSDLEERVGVGKNLTNTFLRKKMMGSSSARVPLWRYRVWEWLSSHPSAFSPWLRGTLHSSFSRPNAINHIHASLLIVLLTMPARNACYPHNDTALFFSPSCVAVKVVSWHARKHWKIFLALLRRFSWRNCVPHTHWKLDDVIQLALHCGGECLVTFFSGGNPSLNLISPLHGVL